MTTRYPVKTQAGQRFVRYGITARYPKSDRLDFPHGSRKLSVALPCRRGIVQGKAEKRLEAQCDETARDFVSRTPPLGFVVRNRVPGL
ncbi:protein of unknown function [Magnetospirillum sp. XM-1]|nr:protein of unknown function [Magnetospirillum sp. XM-1]